MATKREIVSKLTAADLKALADAAEIGLTSRKGWDTKQQKQIKRAVKILRTVRVAAG